MSTEDLGLIVTGMAVVAGAFACGVLVGTSLRKDVQHGNSDEGTKEESGWWHEPVGLGTANRTGCGGTCRTGKERAARAAERAPVGRGDVWE